MRMGEALGFSYICRRATLVYVQVIWWGSCLTSLQTKKLQSNFVLTTARITSKTAGFRLRCSTWPPKSPIRCPPNHPAYITIVTWFAFGERDLYILFKTWHGHWTVLEENNFNKDIAQCVGTNVQPHFKLIIYSGWEASNYSNCAVCFVLKQPHSVCKNDIYSTHLWLVTLYDG